LAQDIPSLANGDFMLMALWANTANATPLIPPAGWTLARVRLPLPEGSVVADAPAGAAVAR
jgi:hypothetical protein